MDHVPSGLLHLCLPFTNGSPDEQSYFTEAADGPIFAILGGVHATFAEPKPAESIAFVDAAFVGGDTAGETFLLFLFPLTVDQLECGRRICVLGNQRRVRL